MPGIELERLQTWAQAHGLLSGWADGKTGKQFTEDWVTESAYTEGKHGKQKEMTDEENRVTNCTHCLKAI